MMEHKTRSGVFETNSSSTHSLSISTNTSSMIDPPLPESILIEGEVHVFPGEFGWEQETYYDVDSKLSYLYTSAIYTARCSLDLNELQKINPNDPEYINENPRLKMIVDAVKQHAGVNVVFHVEDDKYYPFGYIDHQSFDVCDDVWNGGIESVIAFVFNSQSYFETDNDNH